MRSMFNLIILPVFTAWLALNIVVATIPERYLGFEPGGVVFRDVVSGSTPVLDYVRTIHWKLFVQYRVTVRGLDPDQPDGNTTVTACEAQSLPFTYLPRNGPLIGKDLVFWAPGDPRCGLLSDGPYWVETVWILRDPVGDYVRRWFPAFPLKILGPLTPIRYITRESPVVWVGHRPNERELMRVPLATP